MCVEWHSCKSDYKPTAMFHMQANGKRRSMCHACTIVAAAEMCEGAMPLSVRLENVDMYYTAVADE